MCGSFRRAGIFIETKEMARRFKTLITPALDTGILWMAMEKDGRVKPGHDEI